MRMHEEKQTDLQRGRGLASIAQAHEIRDGWTQPSAWANASELAEKRNRSLPLLASLWFGSR